ncbi:hypothetical protein [Paraburkholderia bannensis]|uniref:hypothetical protein n=1 Tax=Paraburkholderia bannensis TaxID=765414 RepID=UPI002AC33D33|nr:hypothetical protein [Paraburkholderia bannensis]
MNDNDTGAHVRALPVKARRDLGNGCILTPVSGGQCFHRHGYLVDERAAEVTCATCHEKLSPTWVLLQLAYEENRWHALHERYQDEMRRLAERERTKCQHCGQLTRISRR